MAVQNFSFIRQVFPDLYMTFNGERVEGEHFVKAETKLNVSCHADIAIPKAVLSLYLFDEKLEAVRDSSSNESSTIISYPLLKGMEPETIICRSVQHIHNDTYLNNSVTIILELSGKKHQQRSQVLLTAEIYTNSLYTVNAPVYVEEAIIVLLSETCRIDDITVITSIDVM